MTEPTSIKNISDTRSRIAEAINVIVSDEDLRSALRYDLRDVKEVCRWYLSLEESCSAVLTAELASDLLIELDVHLVFHLTYHLRSLRKLLPKLLDNIDPDDD